MNQLESLKKYSKVVVDSGDINLIRKYLPEDATTNPSLVLKAIVSPENEIIVRESITYAKKKGGTYDFQLLNAVDKISVILGKKILEVISGRVSTEIDAHLSFNTDLCIERSKKIISMYEEEGIHRSKILIKLAATWECIKASEELKNFDIDCNLTLLFSFAQARACAEAGVFLISPFVGRIYDWYKSKLLIKEYLAQEDPGVQSVRNIYNYYKKHGYKTIIMGASFRNIEQVLELSGCDCLTISPNLLEKLQCNESVVVQKLYSSCNVAKKPISILSQSDFSWLHNTEPMAVEKLSEGIRQFSHDQKELEAIIRNKM
ncbi:transaldolase [Buchnera aphidicola (Schlechtendalia chinensis)]|uniref:Transaldolase n=1 Tax=Buchnera aphidicola subsp. Schlechtendalia chinensis TaxID=118110 RepID=A0A172WD61_BUCSC|nr:transaldolase [Buchnera aphidicola]ANF16901.1 transaldolase [Buchnera aphidicola (Schlechtendalia chinensis)]